MKSKVVYIHIKLRSKHLYYYLSNKKVTESALHNLEIRV